MKNVPHLLFALTLGLTLSCSRDPMTRRREYFESGTRFFQEQKYREAAIQFQNALQTDPRYAEAHYQLALCYLKLEIWEGAYAELLRTVDLAPKNWKARNELGILFLRSQQWKRAQEQARAILAENPNDVEARVLLARTYASEGDYDRAVQEMQEAIQLAPARAESYLALAYIQVTGKHDGEAEKSYKKAVELDPKSSSTALALGNFYRYQRRWNEGEQQFRRAIELAPADPQPRAALAQLYQAQDQKEKAEQVLLEAKKALAANPAGYRMLGDYYTNTGDLEKALSEYALLRKEHPGDLTVKKNYIDLLIRRDRLGEATRLNDEILKANAKDVDSLIFRGQILDRQRRPSDAIPVIESALKLAPDNTHGLYQLGLALSHVGNLGQAERYWREAVRVRPEMVVAQRALAELALRKGDADLLSSTSEQLIRADSSSPDGYLFRSTARIWKREVAAAEADLKKALELAPRNPAGYVRLAVLREHQKRVGEAEKLFEQALTVDPRSVDALQGLVRLYLAQKQATKALARIDAQIAKVPDSSAFYTFQGAICITLKDLPKAEAALEKAADLDQNNVNALLLLGQVQGARGAADQAIASYQQSIARNPRDVRSHVMIGTLEEARGNWQKAQEAYLRSLQVDPENALASNNLAYVMLEHGGNVDVALSYAQKGRQGMPDSPNSADTLAWAYYHKGTYALAIDLLQEAIQKAPQNPTYHYHLGLAYQKSNDKARAKEHLERALTINPKFPKADDARRALAQLAGG